MNTKNLQAPSLDTEKLKINFLNESNHLIKNAILQQGIETALLRQEIMNAQPFVFSNDLHTTSVTNQRQSGRCWIFAGCNFLRHHLEKKLNIKRFELSQGHLFFYDKLEKANYFLQAIIDNIDLELDDRLLHFFLQSPQQDGGQWDMFVSLVEKYGLLPKYALPDTFHMTNSALMNRLLNKKLRLFASDLKENYLLHKNLVKLQELKDLYMQDIYRFLVLTLGEPVNNFDFEYYDKDNNLHTHLNLTPLDFYHKLVKGELEVNLLDYVSIIQAPTKDKPYMKSYTVSYLGNVVGGKLVKYLNLDVEDFKNLAKKQLEAGESIWFGCDVGQFFSRKYGIMDLNLYAYEEAFGTRFKASKEEALNFSDSLMTHAMVLTGVHIVDGQTKRWKIENSWGDEVGDKGYHLMSDEWMDTFTYQIVINRCHLSAEQQKAFDASPIILKPWDPMGSLARCQ